MYIKNCEICGTNFYSGGTSRRTCSKKCRDELARVTRSATKDKKGECDQICFSCQRATGKKIDDIVCPWAQSLSPVEGWDATEIIIREECGTPYKSYDIHSCPLFLADEPIENSDLMTHLETVRRLIKNIK